MVYDSRSGRVKTGLMDERGTKPDEWRKKPDV